MSDATSFTTWIGSRWLAVGSQELIARLRSHMVELDRPRRVAADVAGALFSAGLDALGSFLVVLVDDDPTQLRVLLRGDVRLVVEGPAGRLELAAPPGVATWREELVPVGRIEVRTSDASMLLVEVDDDVLDQARRSASAQAGAPTESSVPKGREGAPSYASRAEGEGLAPAPDTVVRTDGEVVALDPRRREALAAAPAVASSMAGGSDLLEGSDPRPLDAEESAADAVPSGPGGPLDPDESADPANPGGPEEVDELPAPAEGGVHDRRPSGGDGEVPETSAGSGDVDAGVGLATAGAARVGERDTGNDPATSSDPVEGLGAAGAASAADPVAGAPSPGGTIHGGPIEPSPAAPVEHTLAPPRDDGSEDFDFSHLIGETVFRGVEAAAVRDEGVDGDDGPPMGVPQRSEHVSASSPVEPPVPPRPDLPPPPAAAPRPDLPPPPAAPRPDLPPPPAAPPATPASGSGLIDHVPRRAATVPDSKAVEAGREPVVPAARPQATAGDHDGHTVVRSARRHVAAGPTTEPGPGGPTVQAVRCDAGHPNPPHAVACRACGGPISDRTIQVIPRPALGQLRFLGGAVVAIDRPQLIGRRPTVDRADDAAELPGLVALPDPEQAMSRVHAEVHVEGWEVLVSDRGSKNGTTVELPGEPPVRLRPGEPFLIVPGAKVTFAEVAEAVFEVGGR